MKKVTIIGGGLAGCEASLTLAKAGIEVDLYEMKPVKFSPAHHNPNLAELVCSNSLKSDTLDFATGLLKAEMRKLDSELLKCADNSRLPSTTALTVDRERFSALVTEKIKSNPLINVKNEEVSNFDTNSPIIIATGPLCSDNLTQFLATLIGEKLYFYDAVAPIVSGESIDYNLTCPADEGYIGIQDFLGSNL